MLLNYSQGAVLFPHTISETILELHVLTTAPNYYTKKKKSHK